MSDDFAPIELAIRNIETFIQSNEGEEIPNVSDLEIQGEEIVLPRQAVSQRRGVELANCLFAFTMNDNSPQREVLERLKKDVDELGRNPVLLIKLENGPSEQRALAKRVREGAIRFNSLIEQAQVGPKTWRGRIKRRVFESSGLLSVKDLNKIPLPEKYQIKIPALVNDAAPLGERKNIFKDALLSTTSKKVSELSIQVKTELSKQTMDMYFLKAILLLEKEGLCGRQEARIAVMNSPLEIKFSDDFCQITQRFPTFDGPCYVINCQFSRDPRNASNKKMRPDYHIFVSCSLSIE